MSDADSKVKLFESQLIRNEWDAEAEKWWFSVVDVVAVLTDQPDYTRARKYWSVLKVRLKNEGSQLATNCSQLKLTATDGKKYLTDVADTEQILRLIQSIPSKKAEPFKLWLAEVGSQRLDQLQDPELSIEQAMRDNMTNKELIMSMLAELSTKEISEAVQPQTLDEHEDVAKRGGGVARQARLKLEAETGKKLVSPQNAKQLRALGQNPSPKTRGKA
jgi:hypothetical protein